MGKFEELYKKKILSEKKEVTYDPKKNSYYAEDGSVWIKNPAFDGEPLEVIVKASIKGEAKIDDSGYAVFKPAGNVVYKVIEVNDTYGAISDELHSNTIYSDIKASLKGDKKFEKAVKDMFLWEFELE